MNSRTAGPNATLSILKQRRACSKMRPGARSPKPACNRTRSTGSSRSPRPALQLQAWKPASDLASGFATTFGACRCSASAAPAESAGFSLTARLAASDPGSNWLFVTVETCSISIRLDSDDPAAIVATALFGDGAAAAVVSTEAGGLARIRNSAEKLWPDTLGIMGWRVEDPGLGVVFDRAIPPFIEENLAPAIDNMCRQMDIARQDIDRFRCHPGGAKVIAAIETALNLNQGDLNVEREVLRDFGNMSAPTVLFVLDRLLRGGLPKAC